MAESGLIGDYLTALSGQLPAPVVTELADGLGQTREHYLSQGLDPDAATGAALAEFGRPEVIVAAYARISPAQRAARRLLAGGPLVGACWATVLITSKAWAWPVPTMARFLFGLALVTVIGLLAAAAIGRRCRSVRRAGAAGCVGISAVDAALLITIPIVIPVVAWPLALAMAASLARIAFTARSLRSVRAS